MKSLNQPRFRLLLFLVGIFLVVGGWMSYKGANSTSTSTSSSSSSSSNSNDAQLLLTLVEQLKDEQSRRSKQEEPKGEGPYKIKYVALIAERHSGSTFMTGILNGHFKGKDIVILPKLCTWKHWFQDRIHKGIQANLRPCRDNQRCPACMDIEHTLVIALWRNPYDWISGMFKFPHHSQAHTNMPDLNTFMTTRWMLDAKSELKARQAALQKSKEEAPCIDNFLPWEVVPCSLKRDSIYELDPDGDAYDNVYELRKAKILDFNAVQKWAPHYERVLYEDMVTGTGLQDFVKLLENKYGLTGYSSFTPGPSVAESCEAKRAEMYYTNSENCAPACTMGGEQGAKAVETLHSLWDADIEGELGYQKIISANE